MPDIDMPSGLDEPRPRLVFFRWLRPDQPKFLIDQLDDQVACLRLFFDVRLVDYACDYGRVCDEFGPDLTMFESGIYAGPRSISGTDSHPEIPKLGFLNADAFDPVRATFLSDMERWGVDTFVTMSVAMAEYTPEIADNLFVWPNFIDPAVHRDYGLAKVVPVLLTGSQALHYPWRNSVSRLVAQHYPTLRMPHFGWGNGKDVARLTVGEDYARLMNAASIVPTCGSVSRDVVRKHLEIPASRACLVTERTQALESAGYVDMVNCVFADETDVIDKIDHLFRNPDKLQAITDAGFDLAHGSHTASNRRQIRDWYDLYSRHGSASDIVQPNPFGPLVRRTSEQQRARPEVRSYGHDRALLAQAWDAVERADLSVAGRMFERAGTYYDMAEPGVGGAFTKLLLGNVRAARADIEGLLARSAPHGAIDPDPVQWALLLRCMVCSTDTLAAQTAAGEYWWLQHRELSRLRWVISQIAGHSVELHTACKTPRASVNPLPARSWPEWVAELARMVRAAGNWELADHVQVLATQPDPGDFDVVFSPSDADIPVTRRPAVLRRGVLTRFVAARKAALRNQVSTAVRRRLTEDWMRLVMETAQQERLDAAYVVGPSVRSLRERSIRNGLARNPSQPTVVQIEAVTSLVDRLAARRASGTASLALSQLDAPVGSRTLVFVGRDASRTAELADRLASAHIVIIDGVDASGTAAITRHLVRGEGVELVAHRDGGRDGYLVLRRRSLR